jgi:L-rhamnose mutarotase
MARYCFELQVRPDRLDEYRERHRAVWPDMLAALRNTGWRNYSLFVRAYGLLIGYVEADDLRAAQAAMAATEVNARWQAEMAPFFVDLEGRPDEGFLLLEGLPPGGPARRRGSPGSADAAPRRRAEGCPDSRRASATRLRTGFAAELNNITDMSQT